MIRPRYFSRLTAVLAAIVVSGLLGCGGNELGIVPVSGTVKFSDGSIPKGEIATVTFSPVGQGADSKGATGEIQEDGSFQLTTIEPNDGAMVGDYIVIVTVLESYVENKPGVASEFLREDTSPLKAKVEASGANKFDFTVEKP